MAKQRGIAAVAVLAMFFMSCGSHPQTPSQEAKQAQQAQGSASASNQPAASQGQPSAPAEPSPPQVETYTIPAGTPLHIHLSTALSSGTAAAGTPFSGTLSAPLVAKGSVVAPAGSSVAGEVTYVDRGGRLHHPAELSLALTSLTLPGGSPVAISTHSWSARAKSYKKRNAESIGGGAGLGALVGAIAGRGKGAAIGAAVGAGAGTAGAAFTGQKQIVLPAESRLRFVLSRPLTINAPSQ